MKTKVGQGERLAATASQDLIQVHVEDESHAVWILLER